MAVMEVFEACRAGQHSECKRMLRPWWLDPIDNRLHIMDNRRCGCMEPRCRCFKMRQLRVETVDLLGNINEV